MSNEVKAREAGMSYGAYLRSLTIRKAYADSANGWDFTKQKRFDKTNSDYRDAVKAGLEPKNVTDAAIRQAYQEAS